MKVPVPNRKRFSRLLSDGEGWSGPERPHADGKAIAKTCMTKPANKTSPLNESAATPALLRA